MIKKWYITKKIAFLVESLDLQKRTDSEIVFYFQFSMNYFSNLNY